MALPINIEDLLNKRKIEGNRIEFKKGWNPADIYHSLCAFANDFDNFGGGYLLVGVEQDDNGLAKRPVIGINIDAVDGILQKMVGYNNLFDPYYLPRTSVEIVDGRQVLVIWAPSGLNRPYHRDYLQHEPVEITVGPDGITILNCPGPDRSIPMSAIKKGDNLKSRRYRNCRLGDFLKELDLTEGRSTGVPTIQEKLAENGSPRTTFETTEDRLTFLIHIPAHAGCSNKSLETNITETATEKITESTTEKIIRLIKENPQITNKELAEACGITEDGVYWNTKKLKKNNIIRRVGGDKGGH